MRSPIAIRSMLMSNEDEEHALAQQDELNSLAAIFDEGFILLGQDPISYSIRLRPDSSGAVEDGCPPGLALTVTYPPAYPDAAPIFGLSCGGRPAALHEVQELALVGAARSAARVEGGMPCVYGCVRAATEFVEGGGLVQAAAALLSDDCLARVLSFVVRSREDVDGVLAALPVFETASKMNAVWEQLCRRRWVQKWGFESRWKRFLEDFRRGADERFWMRAYHEQEEDARRRSLAGAELSSMAFDLRQWFSFVQFRNQPDNMRDVLPTGLGESVAANVSFGADGKVHAEQSRWGLLRWESNGGGGEITEITLKRGSSSIECLALGRTESWGWELRGSDYVLRSLDEGLDNACLWEDLTSKMMVQEKPDWVVDTHRGPYPYSYREIPDDDDLAALIDW